MKQLEFQLYSISHNLVFDLIPRVNYFDSKLYVVYINVLQSRSELIF